ncbi:BnaCnng42320D [Brassica napus]|uniref:BnaCnng42320D protein n=1 Tax=Brassica napus TaxID=3708 RepID=A0A078JBN9_BRANA|nr:BnaCnng42320D [Brassica napus]
MLFFFSQQNPAKPNYLIQNLALVMVQNTKTTGIRSMCEISLCYISRRRFKTLLWEILRLSLKQTDVLDLLTSTRTTGQPVVDDWDCYKILVKSFKNQCGAKMEYDIKYAGALANICNMGVDVKQSVAAIEEACAH